MSLSISLPAVTVPAVASIGDATPILARGAVRGQVAVPTGSKVTQLAFYSQTVVNGEYRPVYDSLGDAVLLAVVAGRTYQIPTSVFGGTAIKIGASTFSEGTATETNFEVSLNTRAT